MVSLIGLWIPILLAAVAVFIVSSVVHMVLPYHRSDWERLPGEDEVMAAIRATNAPPGDYMFPHGGSVAAMKDPVFIEKMKRGPSGLLTVLPPMETERPSMTGNLVQWFVFILVVTLFAAYIASRALGPGAPAGEIVRFAGTTAFAGYALGTIPNSIWFKRKWSSTFKSVFDGLVYALVTGGVIAWMWPS
jgi:hypothetical protein